MNGNPKGDVRSGGRLGAQGREPGVWLGEEISLMNTFVNWIAAG